MLNDGTFTYTYDDEGNVSTKSKGSGLEKWFYDYDHNNRLLSVRKTSDGTTNTLTVTYAYDVFGNRIKEDRWSSGPGLVTTKFVYVGQEVYLDLTNANAVLMHYIQGDTADEMLVRIDGSGVVDWYLTDRLGSVRDIVDYTGALADSITYNAVGLVMAESTPGYMGNVGYAGMGYDSATGLNTTPRREYDPAIARWLTQDPIVFQAGDPNLYRMVGNNFTNATDPSGLQHISKEGQVIEDQRFRERVMQAGVTPELRQAEAVGNGAVLFGLGWWFAFGSRTRRFVLAGTPLIGVPGSDAAPENPEAWENTIRAGIMHGERAGYGIWAYVLELFLAPKGANDGTKANPYKIPEKYVPEIKLHSKAMMEKILSDSIPRNAPIGYSFGIMPKHVRWVSSDILLEKFEREYQREKYKATDELMFRAYGGADVTFNEVVVTGVGLDFWDVRATVTIEDHADFPMNDWKDRLRDINAGFLANIYHAGIRLQAAKLQSGVGRDYHHTVSFTTEYRVPRK